MATHSLLLIQPVESLGHEGEEVRVKAGYARNYLLPKRLAVPITRANRKQIEVLKARREERLREEKEGAEMLAEKVKALAVSIPVKSGPDGRLFGSVTSAECQRRLEAEGIVLKRKQIQLAQPIKTLGKHTVGLKLHSEVNVDFSFEVVSEDALEAASKDSVKEEA